VNIWIDVDNAPHVQIFRPIVRRLVASGASVSVTARSRTYVPQLLEAAGIEHTIVGEGQPRGTAAKAVALGARVFDLLRFAAKRRFDVAVGHGSRPLAVAARFLKIPNLTMYDYEHVNDWVFRRFSDRILIPRAVLDRALGARTRRPFVPFDGFKEEIYLADFDPDLGIRARLGIDRHAVLVVLRPPSKSAHYHDAGSEGTLEAILRRIASDPSVVAVWLRRDPSDMVPDLARAKNVIVPTEPLDGPSLLASADLAISGGGTMNREAALLGTPAYSIFSGPVGALDEQLVGEGRLTMVATPADVDSIRFVRKQGEVAPRPSTRLREFVLQHVLELARPREQLIGDRHARPVR